MAQVFQPSCPQCGLPASPGQRFCSNCGTTLDAGFNAPTAAPSGGEHYDVSTQLSVPPPPPASAYSPTAQQSFNTYYAPPQAPQAPQSFPPGQESYQSPPVYVKPQKDSSKGVLGQIGCGVLIIIILLVVGICGTTAYFGYKWLASTASSGTTDTTSDNNGTSNNISVPLTTAQINQSLTYSSVDITILNVQKASSFSDDANTDTSTPVLVRLNVKERNPTTGTVFLSYSDNFRLILPDGTSVAPGRTHEIGAINQAVTQTSWIDFPVTSSVDLNKLTLRLGAASQAQMDVPLTGNADLSKYQLKTISPNTSFQYAGLNWTLTTVTSSLSANGKQADSGMRYIVVTLKVDNPTSNTFFPSATDNFRLQAGGTTNPPTNSTLPISIAAGTTNTVGTVTFQMPQNSSSFTLIMLARTDTTPSASQYTTKFQI